MNKIIHSIEPEELMAYRDGEVTPDRVAAVETHLKECAECQSIAVDLRSVSENLRTWKAEPPGSPMPSAIANSLAENQATMREVIPADRRKWREVLGRRWPALAWMGAGAAIALVLASQLTFREYEMSSPARQTHGVSVDSAVVNSAPAGDQVSARLQPPQAQSAAPINGRQFDRLEQFAKLQSAPPVTFGTKQRSLSAEESGLVASGPMIIRTAQLSLITKEFDKARSNLEAILQRHRGYIGELKTGGAADKGRTLTATLHVPADQLDSTLADVKMLGRVESESQSGRNVTSQYVDLQARLANAQNTEQRLTDLLRNRTGKLSDVLEVEQELDRVRGEIEQMEAERKSMSSQVSYATLNTTITEDYKAELLVVPPSMSTRLGNAAVEGYRSMTDGVLDLALFALSNGPTLLLWGAILFFPARLVWKKLRRSFAS